MRPPTCPRRSNPEIGRRRRTRFFADGLAFSRPDELSVSKACGFLGQQTCCAVAGDTDGGESGFNPVGTVHGGF